MTSIDLTEDLNLHSIENLMKVAGKPNGQVALRLPNKIRGSHGFDIETYVLQTIATWIRNTKTKTICNTDIENSSDKVSIELLCSSLVGICTLSLVDSILCKNGEIIKKKVALDPAIAHLSAIREGRYEDAFHTGYVGIPHIKGPNNKTELLSPLYHSENVVGAEKFARITRQIIDSIIQKQPERELLSGRRIKNLSEIVRELFTNTNKHARRDEFGNILGKNFRCVTFRLLSLTKDDVGNLVKSGGPKMAIYASNLSKLTHQKPVSFINISIIDAGPGFACRWEGKSKGDLTQSQERDAVIACFKKHNTTDPISSSGSGLTNVLRDLRNMGGLLRLRTGHALVEKTFNENNDSLEISNSDVRIKKHYAEGSTLNLLIPLVPNT